MISRGEGKNDDDEEEDSYESCNSLWKNKRKQTEDAWIRNNQIRTTQIIADEIRAK